MIQQSSQWVQRHWRYLLAALLSLILLGFVALAAFPWAMLDKTIETRLSQALDRPVTIGSLARVDHFSLHPVLEIRDLQIPQPDWVEGDAPMLTVKRMRIGFSALSLLGGNVRTEMLDVEGAQATLIRRADKTTNWSGRNDGERSSGSSPLQGLRRITLRDVAIDYRDAVQDRRFSVTLSGSDTDGLTLSGTGKVRGGDVTVSASGAAFSQRDNVGRWPFALTIEGSSVGFVLQGSMAAPLAFDDIDASAKAHGSDLANVDALIEAGLPSTQPVRMEARLRRQGDRWEIADLTGTVGRSDFAGSATIVKSDGHSQIDGELRSRRFDFADLASDAGRAKAAAKEARIGERVIPDTAIDLSGLGNTDGTLRIQADELLWPGSKPFRSLKAVLTLDGNRLTVSPLTFGMPHGTLAGEATVVQKEAGPELHLVLTLADGQLADLFPSAEIAAAARGKLDLTGTGKTIRAAIGTANGRVALIAENGTIPDKTALLLGQDIGGGLFAGDKKRAQLRCIVADFRFSNGTARLNDTQIDTSRALTRAGGTISFPSETLSLAVNGVPKQGATLRVEGAIPVHGTIRNPQVEKPESADSLGDILGEVVEEIFAGDDPIAGDLDCSRAAAAAMHF
ncbi:AsmA family protein [Sphingosinithalassobacter portus]|uniref:AsmA family protein n=1 Tax=Stakelama portus TaxID=2676234 RepID=UPI000D6DDC21|nr:AsmA-like C-terminal region-containing protein [Sphingosinithalassobacter portus]